MYSITATLEVLPSRQRPGPVSEHHCSSADRFSEMSDARRNDMSILARRLAGIGKTDESSRARRLPVEDERDEKLLTTSIATSFLRLLVVVEEVGQVARETVFVFTNNRMVEASREMSRRSTFGKTC